MSLPLHQEIPHQLILEDVSDIIAQRAAFDYAGITPDEQPAAVVYGTDGYQPRLSKLGELTLVDTDIEKPIESDLVVYQGEATVVCIGALRELARSRRSYQQRNAARILSENGMGRTALVSRVIATAKVIVSKPQKPDFDAITQHMPPVQLNHDIDVARPWTETDEANAQRQMATARAELKRLRDEAAIAVAVPVKPREERDRKLEDDATGNIASALSPVERELLLAA